VKDVFFSRRQYKSSFLEWTPEDRIKGRIMDAEETAFIPIPIYCPLPFNFNNCPVKKNEKNLGRRRNSLLWNNLSLSLYL
jgi:hypothetical protein